MDLQVYTLISAFAGVSVAVLDTVAKLLPYGDTTSKPATLQDMRCKLATSQVKMRCKLATVLQAGCIARCAASWPHCCKPATLFVARCAALKRVSFMCRVMACGVVVLHEQQMPPLT